MATDPLARPGDGASAADISGAAILERLDRIDRRLDLLGAPDPPVDDEVPPTAAPPRKRRFTLLDLMILVAFAALPMPAYRFLIRAISGVDLANDFETIEAVFMAMMIAWSFATPVAAALSLATAALRLIPPRPPLRALASQAGSIGVVVVSFMVVTVGTIHGTIYGWFFIEGLEVPEILLILMVGEAKIAGCGVIGVWLSLWAAGRFRGPADWVDALGRVLCVYWIVSGVLNSPFF